MSTTKAYIVGGGLFGSMIATNLLNLGYSVTIFDCNKEYAGSKPAACLMKPSWMASLDYKPILKFLESSYDLKTLKFSIAKLPVDVFWVNPKSILSTEADYVKEQVVEVGNGFVRTDNKTYKGLVVVAAGVWCNELLQGIPETRALMGSAIIGKKDQAFDKNVILPYAPYRQAVWFNRGATPWFGDGTAIIEKNFTQDHVDKTIKRAKDLANFSGKVITGKRPYMKGYNNGFFQKLGDKLYVSTGGAKNGTIIAAYNTIQLQNSL